MATTKEAPATKVRIEDCRFSYANVFHPTAVEEGQQKKYNVSLIISKKNKTDIAKLNKGIEAAIEQGKDKELKGKPRNKWTMPLRDGDEERPNDEAYKNSFFINAKSTRKPQVIDRKKEVITEESEEFYSGCYGRATVTFFPYAKAGNVGIGCGLGNLQKVKDGEPLSSISSADEDFDEYEDDDDTEL